MARDAWLNKITEIVFIMLVLQVRDSDIDILISWFRE